MNEYGSIDGGTTTRDYDQNGNLVDTDRYEQGDWTKRKQFTYDAFNRLVEVKEAGVLRARYAYDHKGRRVRREVNWNPLVDSTIDETVNYYYLGNQVIEEQDESGVTQRQYVWGGGTLLQMKAANGAVTETVYAHENAYGSVIKTTRVVAGAPVAHSHSDYDAYGGSAYFTAPLIAELPYRLRGMRYDPETSFYSISNGAYYNPALGSFLSRVLVSPAFSRYAVVRFFLWRGPFFQVSPPVVTPSPTGVSVGITPQPHGMPDEVHAGTELTTTIAAGSACPEYRWIQVVTTTRPPVNRRTGEFAPETGFVDPWPPDDSLPFYWTDAELQNSPASGARWKKRTNAAGDIELRFFDKPIRQLRPYTDHEFTWVAQTCLVCRCDPSPSGPKGNKLEVVTCFEWGFRTFRQKNNTIGVKPFPLTKRPNGPSANFKRVVEQWQIGGRNCSLDGCN